MNQIFQIFKKDVRHLWPWILLVQVLFLLQGWLDVIAWPTSNSQPKTLNAASGLVKFLLTIAVGLFTASAVLAETIPGDRQFWLTRPYSRARLFIAKLLLIILFINVPLLISDICILSAQGLLEPSSLTPLLLRQVAIPIIFVLPAFAIATVANGIMQFLLGWFLILILTVLQAIVRSAMAPSHGSVSVDRASAAMLIALLAIVSVSVILWQYWTRRTTVARLALLFVILFSFPIIDGFTRLCWQFTRNPIHQQTTSPVHVSYDPHRNSRMGTDIEQTTGIRQVMIPLQVSGVPPKMLLRGTSGVSLRLNFSPWPKPGIQFNGSVKREGDLYWQTLPIDEKGWWALNGQKIDAVSSGVFELVTDTPVFTTSANAHRFQVPHLGPCRISDSGENILACRTARGIAPEFSVTVKLPGGVTRPFPDWQVASLPLGWSPTVDWSWPASPIIPEATLTFIPRYPRASWSSTFSAAQLQLPAVSPNTAPPIH